VSDEVYQQRKLRYVRYTQHGGHPAIFEEVNGDRFEVAQNGVILHVGNKTRIFIPWARVESIQYTVEDRDLDARLHPAKYRTSSGGI
jgi:hypothetical protein